MDHQYFTIAETDGTELRYNPLLQQFKLVDKVVNKSILLSLEEVQKFFNPAPKYIITNAHFVNGATVEGDTLFWSNEDGWIEPADNISVFPADDTLELPIGGYWYHIFG